MKKFYVTAILLFLASIATINAQLYMVGGATSGGWTLENATAMDQVQDGVYSWSGSLKAGDLKFVTTTSDYHPCYVATENDQSVQIGTPMELVYREFETEDIPDFKFMFASGNYTITVTTGENPTMTVSAGPNTLYMIGGATQGGWDLAKATAMTYADGKYIWTGELLSGDLKFLSTNNDFMPCYVAPAANQPVEMSTPMTLIYKESYDDAVPDNKFMFEAGKYTIDVVLGDNATMTVRYEGEPEPAPVPENLFIVGDVNSWDVTGGNPVQMQYNAETSTFTWSGTLPDGEVKFLTDSKNWFPCYVAENALTLITSVGDGNEWKLLYRTEETEGSVPDYKFFFYEGLYDIIIDFSGSIPVMTVDGTISLFDTDIQTLQIVGTDFDWVPKDMECLADGVFEYNGTLHAGEDYVFRFIWHNEWWPSMIAMGGEKTSCDVGGEYAIAYMPKDNYNWQFYLAGEAGTEKDVCIKVDLVNFTMSVSEKSTGIIESENATMEVSSNGNRIIIDNIEGEYVVSDLSGQRFTGVAESGERVEVTVGNSGVYIVKSGSSTQKVLVID